MDSINIKKVLISIFNINQNKLLHKDFSSIRNKFKIFRAFNLKSAIPIYKDITNNRNGCSILQKNILSLNIFLLSYT